MECVVRNLQGEAVGRIAVPVAGPFCLKLDQPWRHIEEAINCDIQDAIPLPTPDHKSKLITGTTDAELAAIIHVIRVLSERKLRIN